MTHPLNCLIVEDEPLAATILEDFVRQIPYLRLTGRCADALQALEALREAPVEVSAWTPALRNRFGDDNLWRGGDRRRRRLPSP